MSEPLSEKQGCLWMLRKLFGIGGKPLEAGRLPFRLREGGKTGRLGEEGTWGRGKQRSF